MAGGGRLGSLQPVTVNKRLLVGSLAVAAIVVVAVGIVAANRDDSGTNVGHDDDFTLTSSNDLSPTIGTNAAVTGEPLPRSRRCRHTTATPSPRRTSSASR